MCCRNSRFLYELNFIKISHRYNTRILKYIVKYQVSALPYTLQKRFLFHLLIKMSVSLYYIYWYMYNIRTIKKRTAFRSLLYCCQLRLYNKETQIALKCFDTSHKNFDSTMKWRQVSALRILFATYAGNGSKSFSTQNVTSE